MVTRKAEPSPETVKAITVAYENGQLPYRLQGDHLGTHVPFWYQWEHLNAIVAAAIANEAARGQ